MAKYLHPNLIAEDAAPTGLENILEGMFYKDAAPTALDPIPQAEAPLGATSL